MARGRKAGGMGGKKERERRKVKKGRERKGEQMAMEGRKQMMW